MSKKKEIHKWRELFSREQQGKKPEEMMYQPTPEISTLPYFDLKRYPSPSFQCGGTHISHSFVVDVKSLKWFSNYAERLKPYNIRSIYGYSNVVKDKQVLRLLEKIDHKDYKGSLPGDDHLRILDFRFKNDLQLIKETIRKAQPENPLYWVIPAYDFLWNVGLLRGIEKYISNSTEKISVGDFFQIYLPLKELHHNENESQLIPLSNQILSLMVSGVNHFIWDVREISHWQEMHLTTIMNVPEILAREGKVLSKEDPIQGSAFFEELSNKVYHFLR